MPSRTPIETLYAQRFEDDLEKNRAEQEETTKAIASLQERLKRLTSDEQVLMRMRDSLPAHTPPAANATEPQEKAVPQPRQDDTGDAPKKAARKAPVKKTAAKKAVPPLRELLEAILDRHNGEPRTVREVRDELIATHPDRTTHDQVVRNTLESGVAAGRIDRLRQQGSVMYTLHKITTDPAPETAGSTAGEETEKAAAHA